MTEWQPSTEAEAALRDALRNGDQEMYFRILARVELLLPVSADALAGRAPMGWATWSADTRTHLLAFTSTEAMYACLADNAGSARRVPYHQLAEEWPNHDWWLAINPGLPIEAYLPAWFVTQLARGDVRLPGRTKGAAARVEPTEPAADAPVPAAPPLALEAAPGSSPDRPAGARHANTFAPANQVERDLFDAAEAGDTDAFQSVLLLATVLVPITPGADPNLRPRDPDFDWHFEEINGDPFIVVYTSPERAASAPPECELVKCRFVQLIAAWPDERLSFAVNPGTPVGATLPGDQVLALASWAAQMGLGTEDRKEIAPAPADPARAAADAVIDMQKAIAPGQVSYYLDRGYDRVSGFVHRAREVGRLKTPAQVRTALGLTWSGSPFAADAEEIYVLRWAAHRPSLYRIPYGGATEAAMKAMEGWVIERAPFRGNGFAPGESREIIAEFKVDSTRLPHGARLFRLRADGSEDLVAVLDADGPRWLRVGGELAAAGDSDAYVGGAGGDE